MTSKERGLNARIVSRLDDLRLRQRPSLQAQAIPPARQGRDILGITQTGTGKTAAFGIPLVVALSMRQERPGSRPARGLIPAPPRELASRILQSLQRLTADLRIPLVVGGKSPNAQAERLARGTDILGHGQAVLAMAVMIAFLAFPVLAQDGTGPMPENAEARNYGGGWDCTLGYRVDGADCVAVDVPENAYATGRSHGSGWACKRGYEEVGGASCEPIPVPENAYLRSSGFDWQCDRGYRQDREACVPIVLPEHGYLTEDTSGSGWACDRGFTPSAGACVPMAVPENGYLTNVDYGAEWACKRGFIEIDGRCDPVALPANAYLDPTSYGPGWRCERGFEAVNGACVAMDLPANAHLDRSGNSWRCDRSFQLSDRECVLGR